MLLASVRLANLPSVVSNVWLGVALGAWASPAGRPLNFWLVASLLALAGCALYISGNLFNDWYDRDWDARHRPERALPQGVFPPAGYLGFAVGFAIAGFALAGFVSLPSGCVAALIVGCILGYTRWHKVAGWPILLMGLCRGLLPLLFLIQWPIGAGWGSGHGGPAVATGVILLSKPLALLLYIVALSRIARHESTAAETTGNSLPALSLLALAIILMNLPPAPPDSLLAALGLLPCLGWLVLSVSTFRRPVSRQISALLAGLPLLDWIVLLPLGWVMLAQPALHAVGLVSLWLPPLAFVAGRLLQRVAAAT